MGIVPSKPERLKYYFRLEHPSLIDEGNDSEKLLENNDLLSEVYGI